MASYTHEEFVTAILTHHPQRVGLAPPRLTPNEHRAIARAALAHGLDPFSHPADLAIAEGFRLFRADLPRRCGVHVGGDIYIPRWAPVETEAELIIHERSHGWAVRRRDDANEADAWWISVHLAVPEARLGEVNPHLSAWFHGVCEEAHDSITFVMLSA